MFGLPFHNSKLFLKTWQYNWWLCYMFQFNVATSTRCGPSGLFIFLFSRKILSACAASLKLIWDWNCLLSSYNGSDKIYANKSTTNLWVQLSFHQPDSTDKFHRLSGHPTALSCCKCCKEELASLQNIYMPSKATLCSTFFIHYSTFLLSTPTLDNIHFWPYLHSRISVVR